MSLCIDASAALALHFEDEFRPFELLEERLAGGEEASRRDPNGLNCFMGVDALSVTAHILNVNMQPAVEIGGMIARTPGIKRGSPHLTGTGVLVRTIARLHMQGLLPEEIAAEYGHLTLAQVHAALAYYLANREAFAAEITAEDAEAERLEREHLHPACLA